LMDRDRITRTGARAPGAEYYPTPRRRIKESSAPTQNGTTDCDYEVREGWMQTVSQLVNVGSRLKPLIHWEGTV
jgi:hypothetical protein